MHIVSNVISMCLIILCFTQSNFIKSADLLQSNLRFGKEQQENIYESYNSNGTLFAVNHPLEMQYLIDIFTEQNEVSVYQKYRDLWKDEVNKYYQLLLDYFEQEGNAKLVELFKAYQTTWEEQFQVDKEFYNAFQENKYGLNVEGDTFGLFRVIGIGNVRNELAQYKMRALELIDLYQDALEGRVDAFYWRYDWGSGKVN